ncbi:MAG TPA: ferritin-like domain-containing protein [Tepidisphaeraceae bacterium]|nr:ferritin-like domain-containing protein [Tepidisphaeraceae bacterium]
MALLNYQFDSLSDLFVHELKDLYDAEHRLIDALPDMANAAVSADLKQAFSSHLEQTRDHVRRLEEVFRGINCEPDREACKAMKGIVDEGSDIVSAKGDTKVRDAGLIAAAQRAEHYEMAGYGSARTFAKQLGRDDLAQILQSILNEEGEADKKLTSLAESHVNWEAQAGA